jgi:multidrug resistance efflux pump
MRFLPVLTFLLLVVGIYWLWTPTLSPSAIVAEAKTTRANVLTTIAGTIQEISVSDMQRVKKGQELVVLSALDPVALQAERQAVEAELQLMKAQLNVDRVRNQDAFSQMRTRLMEERISLSVAQVNLQEAEATFEAVNRLYERQLVPKVSDDGARGVGSTALGYDAALRQRDALRSEVAGRVRAIAQLERDVAAMSASSAVEVSSVDRAIEDAIRAQQARIESLDGRTVLRSPIDGFVSVVNSRAGERVPAGQPILVVSAEHVEHIVAWVRQPLSVRPEEGDVVRVRAAGHSKPFVESTVVRVGSQMEAISPTLLVDNESSRQVEVGLPFLIKVPDELDLVPGEMVEVVIEQ